MKEVLECPKEQRELLIKDITINGGRARQEFGRLDELAQSMKEVGVITPISVMEVEKGKYKLLAGERRCMAAKQIGLLEIPALIYKKKLDKYNSEVIELYENVHRKDLEWWERIKMVKRIHETYEKLYGTKITSHAPGWGKKDTAKVLGVDSGAVTKDLQMAGMLERFPELKSVKTRDEARKILTTAGRDMLRRDRAKSIEEKMAATPIDKARKKLIDSFIISDVLEGLAKVESSSIDIVELDPPFGIELDKTKKDEFKLGTRDYDEISKKDYPAFLEAIVSECYRIMANDSWLLLWGALDKWFLLISRLLKKQGFVFGIPAIWTKGTGQTRSQQYYLASSYEQLIYARKGHPSIVKQGRSNDFRFKPIPPTYKIHPTEKPIQLYQEILGVFAWEGARLCSPLLGSGNVILAASNLNLDCFGFDLSQTYKDAYALKVHDGQPGEYKSKIEGKQQWKK